MKIQNQVAVLGQSLNSSFQNESSYSIKPFITKDLSEDNFVKNLKGVNQFKVEQGKNYIKVVSFGALKNPTTFIKPAIQLKVQGVTRFQHNMDEKLMKLKLHFSINELAESKWKDGEPLDFQFGSGRHGTTIDLFSKRFGQIGRVTASVTPYLLNLMKKEPQNFQFELSNLVAGNTKGAGTIGVRVNLLYNGKYASSNKKVQDAMNSILNDSNASQKAYLYQPMKTPNDIFKEILDFEAKTNGVESAKKMESVVNNIVKVLEAKETSKILLVGHCKPDGDTLGCIMGLKNSINMMYPEKFVECAVDDEVTGLFRH